MWVTRTVDCPLGLGVRSQGLYQKGESWRDRVAGGEANEERRRGDTVTKTLQNRNLPWC